VSELGRQGVEFLPETKTRAIKKTRAGLAVVTSAGELQTELVILAVGVRPNTEMAARAGLKLGDSGALKVDPHQRTPVEGIYAVGDGAEVYHRISRRWVHTPLGDIANKQGRIAGRNIGGDNASFPGIVGAQSFRVFGLEAAATGLDEEGAAASGYDPVGNVIWAEPLARAMPEQKKIGLKMVADRATGRLLGAQAIGNTGVVSRINTLSACLWAEMELDQIGYMDLAYAPVFSGAWDVIHTAAQTLNRML
ncbi:MAG: FAD-dependent oxidoreductase, partial [Smithellaceae bacterium]|nr:FAD-dependent oxidoreductase [Smithellaceae bacterium]